MHRFETVQIILIEPRDEMAAEEAEERLSHWGEIWSFISDRIGSKIKRSPAELQFKIIITAAPVNLDD